MNLNHCAIGDCRVTLPTLDADTFHCCVTSPPYWGLRDYGHPKQIGLEQTPEEFVAELVAVFREVRRVLRDDGTLWLNLGDCYANDGKWGGSSGGKHVRALHGKTSIGRSKRSTGLKPKDLVGMPWRVAFALQADGWWLRSDIVWSKPNPMPESVTDRPTKAHEYVFLLSKSERYFYDSAAIAEPLKHPESATEEDASRAFSRRRSTAPEQRQREATLTRPTPTTRNARTVWTIPSEPYDGAHFACFPTQLAQRCILAGSPLGGLVLDPFFGSGTVGEVAEQLGRKWFGCEIQETYAPLIARRTQQRGFTFEVSK